jgi:hypothetical protein
VHDPRVEGRDSPRARFALCGAVAAVVSFRGVVSGVAVEFESGLSLMMLR